MQINPNVKHYKVRYKKEEDIAKIILKFLGTPSLYKKEASILNGKGDMHPPLPGFLMPPNLYAATYEDNNIPSYDELNKVLMDNGYGFSCMGATDKADRNRIGLMGMPHSKDMHLPPELKNLLMLTTYTPQSKDFVDKLIDELEDV